MTGDTTRRTRGLAPTRPARGRALTSRSGWVVLGTCLLGGWLLPGPVAGQEAPREVVPTPIPTVPAQILPDFDFPRDAVQAQPQEGQGGKLPEKVNGGKAGGLEQMPPPRVLDPLGVTHPRLSRMGGPPMLGKTPLPTARQLEEYKKYVKEVVDPGNTLDLVQGRARLLVLQEAPRRVQIADETVAIYNLVGPKEITLLGKAVGSTVFNLWFVDPNDPAKEKVLSYLVRVVPDPEAKERMEAVYKALEDEINRTFPDSIVHLRLVGDKLVITGQAHDIVEATQILRIVRANAPPDENARNPALIQTTTSASRRASRTSRSPAGRTSSTCSASRASSRSCSRSRSPR
jgi:Pilus formation protein N terminal region